MRRLLILLMLVGLCGCASVPTDEGPKDYPEGEDQRTYVCRVFDGDGVPWTINDASASWVDDVPLTIDSDRPWWQKILFWAGPGH